MSCKKMTSEQVVRQYRIRIFWITLIALVLTGLGFIATFRSETDWIHDFGAYGVLLIVLIIYLAALYFLSARTFNETRE